MDSTGVQRDRDSRVYHVGACLLLGTALLLGGLWYVQVATALVYMDCLLYTSDAADEE